MIRTPCLQGALLIIGTSVGAGMLGLPVESGAYGFFPSLFLLIAVWAIMTATAFALVSLFTPERRSANFASLTGEILGNKMRALTFCVYIALFVSLTFAYVKGGSLFIGDRIGMPQSGGTLLFLSLLVPFLVIGPRATSLPNALLTFLLFAAFFFLVGVGGGGVREGLIARAEWKESWGATPLFITSFGFHSILPSLYRYTGSKRVTRHAIVIGTTTTLLLYVVWHYVVLGSVGPSTLAEALRADQTAVPALIASTPTPLLPVAFAALAFAALTTSFLGVGLGLIDFLLDALSLPNRRRHRLTIALLIYVPAGIASLSSLRIFYLSLTYGGGIACAYLLIALPLALSWKHRHRDRHR